MSGTLAIMQRELRSYFLTPVAYVFIVIFLVLTATFTFYLGNFYERGQADLAPFFNFHPWLYLFLVPALSMRLWAEERKAGSIELLMTLPIDAWEAVLGKFLAAWAFTGVALALTFPMWITVNYLGDPDNGVIVAAYLGSLRQLQDDLGRLNDVAVAESRLGELCRQSGENGAANGLLLASGTVLGWHAHALAQVRPRIAKDWRAFGETPPFWDGKAPRKAPGKKPGKTPGKAGS